GPRSRPPGRLVGVYRLPPRLLRRRQAPWRLLLCLLLECLALLFPELCLLELLFALLPLECLLLRPRALLAACPCFEDSDFAWRPRPRARERLDVFHPRSLSARKTASIAT